MGVIENGWITGIRNGWILGLGNGVLKEQLGFKDREKEWLDFLGSGLGVVRNGCILGIGIEICKELLDFSDGDKEWLGSRHREWGF